MIIYKTTNLINGKIYIGKDSKNNPNYFGSGVIIISALKKYGKENFKKEVLEECTNYDELNEKEKYWIKHFNSTDSNIGYNIREGGDSNPPENPEIRNKRISNALKGRIFTKEHRKKISENHADVSGKKNPMYGKKHSDSVKEYNRSINLGRKPTKEQRIKMSLANKGENNSNSKLTENQVIEVRRLHFEEGLQKKDIALIFNVKPACISKICNYLTWKDL